MHICQLVHLGVSACLIGDVHTEQPSEYSKLLGLTLQKKYVMFFQSLPFSFLPVGGHELILNPSMLTQAECLPFLCSQPRLPQPTHSTLSVPAVDPFKLQDSPCYRCYRIKGCCKIKRSPFEYNHRCPPSLRLFTL